MQRTSWGLTSVAGLGVLMLSACATTEVQEPVSHYFDCQALTAAIDDADSGFANIRKARKNTRYLDIWQTEVQAFGNACRITESSGKNRYVCSAPVKAAAVEEQMNDAETAIGQCLGNEWRPMPGTGEIGTYWIGQPGTDPMVDIRQFENDRGDTMMAVRVYPHKGEYPLSE